MKKLLFLTLLFVTAAQAQPTYRLPHYTLGRWWVGAEDSMTTRAGKFDTTYTDRIVVRNASELIVAAKTRYESTDNVPFAIRNTTAAGAGLSVIRFEDYLGANKGDIGYAGPANIMRAAMGNVDFQFRQAGGAELARLKYDGSLGLGTATPHASALFHISSTTKGFLQDPITTTQRDAIPTPATGLIINNSTTGQHERYNGAAWEGLGGGGTPGGGDYCVQIGIAGAFSCDAGFTLNPTTDLLTTPGRIDGGGDITQPDCNLAGGTAWDRSTCPQIYDVLAANRAVTTSGGQDGTAGYKARITQNATGNFTFSLNGNSISVNPAASSVTNIICHRINTTEFCYSDYVAPDPTAPDTDDPQEWADAQTSTLCTLTDGATVTWDLTDCQIARVVLGGNRTLDATTFPAGAGTWILEIVQDATGTRTLAWDTAIRWPGGTDAVLSTVANSIDIISCVKTTGAFLNCVASKAFAQ